MIERVSPPVEGSHWEQLEALLVDAHTKSVSDIHFASNTPPWLRLGGTFAPAEGFPPTPERTLDKLRVELLTRAEMPEDTKLPATVTTLFPTNQRWRVEMYRGIPGGSSDGLSQLHMAWRRVSSTPPKLTDLGERVRPALALASQPDGLVIVCGTSGAGKSTTIAALIKVILDSRPVHVVTLESPIEYIHNPTRGRVSHRPLNIDEIRSVMRSDADVVLVGEVRTPEEIRATIDIAATGHLVFTSLHASSAEAVCHRVSVACGDDGRLVFADVIRGIITQKLFTDAQDQTVRHLAPSVVIIDSAIRNLLIKGDLDKIGRHVCDNLKADLPSVIREMVAEGRIRDTDASLAMLSPSTRMSRAS